MTNLDSMLVLNIQMTEESYESSNDEERKSNLSNTKGPVYGLGLHG